MAEILVPGVDGEGFLRRAVVPGYSMQNPFITPEAGELISQELEVAELLEEGLELQRTKQFAKRGMRTAALLHATLNRMVYGIDGIDDDQFPFFSVRVFEPGLHATTIHRNDPSIGPWAVGVTLKGEAPFNVYSQEQLPFGTVQPLEGNRYDPVPLDTMKANAGAAWTLYTPDQLVPHSGGIVKSQEPRELLLFYDQNNYRTDDFV